jgi:long-chain acyl-CoA synthetase
MDTLISLIDESCRNFAERTAFLHKTGQGWEETSYDRLRRTSNAIAAGLVGKGFPPGANAALMAPSSPLWVAAYLGILKAGGVVVPIDRELKTLELRHILTWPWRGSCPRSASS